MLTRKTKEQFVTQANNVHDNLYNYDKSIYTNGRTPIEITCKQHGSFWQLPINHLAGNGCPKCGRISIIQKRKKTIEQFKLDSEKIHNAMYGYNKAVYINATTPIEITCKQHGSFWQLPTNHLAGNGCPQCWYEATTSKNEILLREIIKQHYPSLKIETNYRAHPLLNGLEIDVWLPDIGLAIEWNGVYWHNLPAKIHNDNIKKQQLGDDLIQILDEGAFDPQFVRARFLLEVYPKIKSRLSA